MTDFDSIDDECNYHNAHPTKTQHQTRSAYLRQMQDFDNPKHGFNRYVNERKRSTSKPSNSKGFLGLEKGQKPARFNEEFDASTSSQIAMSEYITKAQGAGGGPESTTGRRIKVNLRSINNPADRERYRQMQQ